MAQNNYGLGRGLASLIPPKNKSDASGSAAKNITGDNTLKPLTVSSTPANNSQTSVLPDQPQTTEVVSTLTEIDLKDILPNPQQPRLNFDPEKLQELADSIKEHGIIQPLVVSKNEKGYEVIAGERRLEAAKLAGLPRVPVIIRDATEQQKLEIALIENVQRDDLNPIEEARSYQKLAQEFDLGQEEIAKKVGKSRSAIANKMRLINLPVEIQKALIEGKITEGHAKAILAIDNPEKQRGLYELILKNSLTVRQTESKTKEISVQAHKRNVKIDPEIKGLEDKLMEKLGTKVKVSRSGSGGKILIEYYSKEELDSLVSKIC